MKFACPRCSANLKFILEQEKCFCEHCNNFIEIDEIKNTTDYTRLKCGSCGAKLLVDDINVMANCIYCGSSQLLTKRLEKNPKAFYPEKILPFNVTANEMKKMINDIKLLKKEDVLLLIWYLEVDGKIEFISNGRTGTTTCIIKEDDRKMIYNPLSYKFICENKKKSKEWLRITHKETSLAEIFLILFGIILIVLIILITLF